MTKLVGVTGGIGSGKTLVCDILTKLGVPVYYADREARRLMEEDPEVAGEISRLLGKRAYRNGKLDRSYISEKVFGNDELLHSLNKVVHPSVRRDFADWASRQGDAGYVVEEAAVLFESGAHRYMDLTVLVLAPEKVRIRRVMERDGVDETSVRKRMMHQMDEDRKREMADHLIYNSGGEMLLPQVVELHKKLLNS